MVAKPYNYPCVGIRDFKTRDTRMIQSQLWVICQREANMGFPWVWFSKAAQKAKVEQGWQYLHMLTPRNKSQGTIRWLELRNFREEGGFLGGLQWHPQSSPQEREEDIMSHLLGSTELKSPPPNDNNHLIPLLFLVHFPYFHFDSYGK